MEIAILIVTALLKYGPEYARAVRDILSNPAPTAADWDALFAKTQKSYDDYVKGKSP